jgi:hypothetical protein
MTALSVVLPRSSALANGENTQTSQVAGPQLT